MNNELKKAKLSLQTAKGQIEAIIKMIDEGRYCVDISNQILAVQSLLKKANLLVLEQHLTHCVVEAFKNNSVEEKSKEIMNIVSRISGN